MDRRFVSIIFFWLPLIVWWGLIIHVTTEELVASPGSGGTTCQINRTRLIWINETNLDQLDYLSEEAEGELEARREISLWESVAGRVVKSGVYAIAALTQVSSRIACPIFLGSSRNLVTTNRRRLNAIGGPQIETRQQQQQGAHNEEQPTLYVFTSPFDKQRAFRIYADDEITSSLAEEAQLRPDQATYLFVHGWLGGIHNERWLTDAKNAVLGSLAASRRGSTSEGATGEPRFRPNVLIVEWGEFALGSLFTATRNSLKVSDRLAQLLERLVRVVGLRPELMHCFGHSIGAHICGQAARKLRAQLADADSSQTGNSMGRITGLDPGGFCYELGIRNESQYAGLRPSDAHLVDAYYSNRSPFGNRFQVAAYNVHLNNGYLQKSCSVFRNRRQAQEYFRSAIRFLIGSIGHNDLLTCDHYFATRFAGRPEPSCSLIAYACDSYRNYLRGKCGLCNSANQCYPIEAEYQRARPQLSNALDHVARHSPALNPTGIFADNDTPQWNKRFGGASSVWRGMRAPRTFEVDDDDELLGQVPYDLRRTYFMQTRDETPHCAATFRVRVKLDLEIVDLRSFPSRSLKLRFVGPNKRFIMVKEANSGRISDQVSLHGPWKVTRDEERLYGLDSRTLTCLIELPGAALSKRRDLSTQLRLRPRQPRSNSSYLFDDLDTFIGHEEASNLPKLSPLDEMLLPVRQVSLVYNNQDNKPHSGVESIHIDYLSSDDQRIRAEESLSFYRQHQFKWVPVRQE